VLPFVQLIGGYTFDAYSPLYKDNRNRRVGGFRRMDGGKCYGCCACIGGAGVALMPISSVMEAKDGIRINHLMNGSVRFGALELQMETAYPYGETAVIRVLSAPSDVITIGIRVPAFAIGKMTVDGEPVVADEKGYAVLRRAFKAGDTISIMIPRELCLHRLNGKYALTRGAITFALDERNQSTDVCISGEILGCEEIQPEFSAREALKVTFSDGQRILFTDYASAGAQWDHAKNKITVWMDGK